MAIIGAISALSVTVLAGTANATTSGAQSSRPTQTHAAHVTGRTTPAGAKHITHRAVTPRLPNGFASSTTAETENWAGYTVLNSSNTNTTTFNAISATWNVPAVNCDAKSGDIAWMASWIGFDGFLSQTVEQGGTEAICEGATPFYNVWWEMAPANPIQTGFAVNPGDAIQASVTFNTTTSMFSIVVKDVTLGQTLTENTPCFAAQGTCVRSSAEAITEDVFDQGATDQDHLFFLPDYGTAGFSHLSLTDTTGHTGSVSDSAWNNIAISQVSSAGITKQTVSPLSPDGTSFTTTFQSSFGLLPSIVADYDTNNTSATTNQISPQIELLNNSFFSVPLSTLTVRYWFTEDGTAPLNYACDFVPIGCTNLTGSFVAVNPAVTGADHYLQISFGSGAGTLGVSGISNNSTGVAQERVFQSTFANMTQTNDYSFNAADTSPTANPTITVYFDGRLIYGTEP